MSARIAHLDFGVEGALWPQVPDLAARHQQRLQQPRLATQLYLAPRSCRKSIKVEERPTLARTEEEIDLQRSSQA